MMDHIQLSDLIYLPAKCALLFVLGAFCFDIVHYTLHKFELSPNRFLQFLGGLHGVHHKFLDTEMRVQRQFSRPNILLHVLPEYMTAVVGVTLLGFVFGFLPAIIVIAIRTLMVAVYVFQKGEDITHRELTRIKSNRSLFFVGPHYHALHHVYVNQYYSSFVSLFDLLFGTCCQIRGRRFLVTGASGAYGSAMVQELLARGGVVETATSGLDFTHEDTSIIEEKLERADVVILAHGAKGEAAWDANYITCVNIIEKFRELGRDRLVPPEVWGMGSEIELHPHFGAKDLVDYAESKRAFAKRARYYYFAKDLTYRHIVPSAFRSQMGGGLMSAKTAVKMSLFFITRGFCYVPVTYTSIAYFNYVPFLLKLDQSLASK